MSSVIVGALVACVSLAAVGSFGAPILCQRVDQECPARWQQAVNGASGAAGILSALLATLNKIP